tara:strand:+ start:1316 stop:3775 length:2460 start_codon:yes stop_codon:yes gene_type:complete
MDITASDAQIRASMGHIVAPGQLVEIRALQVPTNVGPRTFSGFFDDLDKFSAAAAKLSNMGASGVYFTLNPLKASVTSQARNLVTIATRGVLSKDVDVVHPKWLLIDIDPERPSKESATDDEKAEAGQVAFAVLSFLGQQGWPEPLLADSGNGYHLLYRLQKHAKVNSTAVRRCLTALAFMFDTETAKIDQKVYNPSRICKIYGTIARKGASSDSRPWRVTTLKPPEAAPKAVKASQLLELAEILPSKGVKSSAPTGLLDNYLETHFQGLDGPHPWNDGGRKWVFPVCPWDSDHIDRAAYVVQFANGAIAAGCLHTGCEGAIRDDKGTHQGWKLLQKEAGTPFKEVVDAALLVAASQYHLTDLGNARRLVDSFPLEILHCTSYKQWFLYDGKRWEKDLDGGIHRRAKQTAGTIFAEAESCPDPERAKRIRKHALRSESARALSAMVQLASTETEVAVSSSRLDTNPWLFNLANGTMDLRTGELRAHDRTDLMTKISPVAWDPDAVCPHWDALLDFAMEGDQRVIDFIHRFFGYCLTGLTTEQVLLFMEGTGQNGKTTALLILMYIMGDYAIQGAPGLLMAKRGETHPTEVADLEGARFVANSEVEKGKPFAETLIKQLTGSDRIRARKMRQDFYEFDPTHKLIIAANHRPIIKGNDEGIWRRVLRLPWVKKIKNKDVFFLEKLKAEAPGILCKLVAGCLEWQKTGLRPPGIVLSATKEYREEMDMLAEFIEDCCELGKKEFVPKKALYIAYVDWCEGFRQKPMGYNLFARQMSERNFRSHPRYLQVGSRKKSIRVWSGISLNLDSAALRGPQGGQRSYT